MEEALAGGEQSYRLKFARDGVELLDCLEKLKAIDGNDSPMPVLVLLDLNMPRMDGHQTLREIKADARLRSNPVVVWTTSHAKSDETECYEDGADGFATKPNSFREVQALLRKLLRTWIPNCD